MTAGLSAGLCWGFGFIIFCMYYFHFQIAAQLFCTASVFCVAFVKMFKACVHTSFIRPFHGRVLELQADCLASGSWTVDRLCYGY